MRIRSSAPAALFLSSIRPATQRCAPRRLKVEVFFFSRLVLRWRGWQETVEAMRKSVRIAIGEFNDVVRRHLAEEIDPFGERGRRLNMIPLPGCRAQNALYPP